MNKLLLIVLILLLAAGLSAEGKRDPTRAALYSLVLPGGGQIYNHAYLKAGLVIGVQGWLIGSAIHHANQRDKFRELAETAPPALEQQYLADSEEYRDKLNNDIWWIGIAAALSVFDAYVDAHLSDFEEQKEKLRLRFDGEKLSLHYRW